MQNLQTHLFQNLLKTSIESEKLSHIVTRKSARKIQQKRSDDGKMEMPLCSIYPKKCSTIVLQEMSCNMWILGIRLSVPQLTEQFLAEYIEFF